LREERDLLPWDNFSQQIEEEVRPEQGTEGVVPHRINVEVLEIVNANNNHEIGDSIDKGPLFQRSGLEPHESKKGQQPEVV
jgi:hypothetical protein